MEVSTAKRFKFGDFELDGTRRLLLRRGEPVTLNPKTFDLLYTLLERHGDILTKDELLKKIWPGQFVEEGNLTVHVSTLRKVFGESKREHRFIVTVPGRGYGFVADLDSGPVAEVTVESRSSSRIVVEEEINEKTRNDIGPKHTQYLRVAYWAAGGVIAVLIIVAGAFLLNDLRSRAIADVPHYTALVFASGGGGIPDRVAISPDGKTIAFVDRINGRSSMRLGEADSFNSVEIIPAADRFYHFVSFSPDGQKVYFTVREDKRRLPTLMRVSILGGQVHELIYDISGFFTFSPDGRSIAFMRRDGEEGKVSIVVADADTGKNERVLLTREKPENISGSGLSWSPDGKLIAFAEAAGGPGFRLAALNVETGEVQKINEPAEGRIVNLVWLRDGSGLAVNRNDTFYPNDGTIWHVPFPSGTETVLTDESLSYSFRSLSAASNGRIAILQTRMDPQVRVSADGDLTKSEVILSGSRMRQEGMHGLAWAPDGKVVFAAIANGSRTIWELDPETRSQKQLTPFEKDSSDAQVNVTADNRFIVFESNRSGGSEIWRANRDGSDLTTLTRGGGNFQPTLSPDGSWVIYVSEQEGRFGLRRVSIEGGEPIELTAEKSYWPAVSPDGKYIAFVYGGPNADPNRDILVIPFEGGEPVKRFRVAAGAILYNRLQWSPDSKTIVYKNEFEGLWSQSLADGATTGMPSSADQRVTHFAYSRDGKLLTSGGLQMREIVILERSTD